MVERTAALTVDGKEPKDFKFIVNRYGYTRMVRLRKVQKISMTVHRGVCHYAARARNWEGYDDFEDVPKGAWRCSACRPYEPSKEPDPDRWKEIKE